jgi:apolipoprotein N-acyltransferase
MTKGRAAASGLRVPGSEFVRRVFPVSPCGLALAVLSGWLLTQAFPPRHVAWLGWVALIPLMVAVRNVRPWAGFVTGLISGSLFFALCFPYIRQFGLSPWLALAVFQGLFVAVAAFLAGVMWRAPRPWLRVAGVAAAWSAGELLRGYCGALQFTFCDLGYSQYRALAAMQIASLAGHYGLGFVVALIGAAVVEATPRLTRREPAPTGAPLVVIGLALIVLLVWGRARAARLEAGTAGPTLDVMAVQASAGAEPANGQRYIQEVTQRYIVRSMTDGRGADLIVWPETAVPARINETPALMEWVRTVPQRLGCTLLAGAAEAGPGGRTYNTLWGLGPHGESLGKYRKQQLVIFGEYVPWRDKLKFLERYPIRDFDYSPGVTDVLFPVKGFRVAPMICFESIFPEISRRLARKGADVLVVATSDSWVEDSPAAPTEFSQHAQCSPFRAVETGRWLIRAACTGVTCLIAPSGRIVREVPVDQVASARCAIRAPHGNTCYTKAGDWPLVGLIVVVLLAGLAAQGAFSTSRRSAA